MNTLQPYLDATLVHFRGFFYWDVGSLFYKQIKGCFCKKYSGKKYSFKVLIGVYYQWACVLFLFFCLRNHICFEVI